MSVKRQRNECRAAMIEARMSVDGSLQENLFDDNQDQDLQQVRDAMNAQEVVSEPSMDDSHMCHGEQGQEDDDTGVDAPVGKRP